MDGNVVTLSSFGSGLDLCFKCLEGSGAGEEEDVKADAIGTLTASLHVPSCCMEAVGRVAVAACSDSMFLNHGSSAAIF